MQLHKHKSKQVIKPLNYLTAKSRSITLSIKLTGLLGVLCINTIMAAPIIKASAFGEIGTNDMLLAVGANEENSEYIAYSIDNGRKWTAASTNFDFEDGHLKDVGYGNIAGVNQFIAISNHHILWSLNGRNWTENKFDLQGDSFEHIAIGANHIIITGQKHLYVINSSHSIERTTSVSNGGISGVTYDNTNEVFYLGLGNNSIMYTTKDGNQLNSSGFPSKYENTVSIVSVNVNTLVSGNNYLIQSHQNGYITRLNTTNRTIQELQTICGSTTNNYTNQIINLTPNTDTPELITSGICNDKPYLNVITFGDKWLKYHAINYNVSEYGQVNNMLGYSAVNDPSKGHHFCAFTTSGQVMCTTNPDMESWRWDTLVKLPQ